MTLTQDYYGTKRITAWHQPSDIPEGSAVKPRDGYAVKYADGYTSWSPKEVFEAAYQPITAMSFGHALTALKEGHKVCRAGWNGKGMWLVLVDGTPDVTTREGTTYHNAGLEQVSIDPHIDMKTAQGTMQPGWLCSQADMLAEDWMIVD